MTNKPNQLKGEKKITRCGMCGVFMADGEECCFPVETKNYELDFCQSCANEENNKQHYRVTKDMAIDAGIPELEGQLV